MRQAFGFLTVVGGPAVPSPRTLGWFPSAGAVIGALLGGLWWSAARIWPPAVAAALVVALDLALTGMLHFDGLADAADGLLPHLERDRRLAVMREPDVGAFGVAATGAALLLRWAALAALAPSVWLLAGLWAASRAFMAAVATSVPYARGEGGLASALLGDAPDGGGGTAGGRSSRRRARAVAGLSGAVLASGCCLLWSPSHGLVPLAAGLAGGAGVVWLARRRLGGFTGDVLGAAGVVVETVGLLAAAARW